MVLVRRFGGWRPVGVEDGVGALRRRNAGRIEGVGYAFEIWHQFVEGFHGPFRCEGTLTGVASDELAALLGKDLLLEMSDGRFLPLRLSRGARFVGHGEPRATDPWIELHVAAESS